MTTLLAKNAVTMPYRHFKDAQQQLFELSPIDYYFAQEVLQVLGADSTIVFHLAVCTHQYLQKGHSCLPLKEIAAQIIGQKTDEDGQITHHGFEFPTLTEIETELLNFPPLLDSSSLLVLDNKHVYLRRYYLFEQQLSQFIKQKRNAITHVDNAKFAEVVAQLFEHTQDIDWQKLAVANALNKDFVVIAGGPGTGKTYTVTKLLAALIMLHQSNNDQQTLNIALTAPTGKAAQRLSESIIDAINGFVGVIEQDILAQIPHNAQTIHRLLGVKANQVNFKHNEDNQLAIDVLLIDEASMIDLALMTRIFRALPEHTKVILLGDADQLPSVAAGSVLADISQRPHLGYSEDNISFLNQVLGQNLNSLLAKTSGHSSDHLTILQHSRRFDGAGGIGVIAKAVIEGNAKVSWQRLLDDPSLQTRLVSTPITSWLGKACQQYYQTLLTETDRKEAFKALSQFRILVATRKGALGVENLNQLVVDYFIEHQLIDASQKFTNQPMYHGMPIMITENHHRLGLYNGDIGLIWQKGEQFTAIFEQADGFKEVIPSRLPKFELVYAMTIHKTQGSEFSHVLMALPDTIQNKLLTRELLYTGITRAKKQLSIVGDYVVWQQGVTARVIRHSQLEI